MCEPRVVEGGSSRKRCFLPVMLSVGAVAAAVLVIRGVDIVGEGRPSLRRKKRRPCEADLRHSAADAKSAVEGRGGTQPLAANVPKLNWGAVAKTLLAKAFRLAKTKAKAGSRAGAGAGGGGGTRKEEKPRILAAPTKASVPATAKTAEIAKKGVKGGDHRVPSLGSRLSYLSRYSHLSRA